MTKKEYKKQLLEYIHECNWGDTEAGHCKLDALNEELLFQLGYIDDELKEQLDKCYRWYA